MATAPVGPVMHYLYRAVLRQDVADRTDGQLLAAFIDQKEEVAFEALVRRHGPMVFGVCRRLLHNDHDAEDAFQATFLVLARKAASVRPRERVASWLHGVALRTARKARATTAKLRAREKQVPALPEPAVVPQDPWRDLQPLLDQELNALPEYYRLAILLCDLEGKTLKEAAQQLGWPQGTLAGRLTRGRKLLARRLASRGVTLSAGSLAAILTQNEVSAAMPPSLLISTGKTAAMIAAGQATSAGVVPAKVAALAEGVLKTMLVTRLKIVTVVLLVLTAAGAGGLLSRTPAAEPGNDAVSIQQKEPPRAPDSPPSLVSLERQVQKLQDTVDELRKEVKGLSTNLGRLPDRTVLPATPLPVNPGTAVVPPPDSSVEAWANKLFVERTKDFGECQAGTQLKHRFPMTNPYSVPLRIAPVRVSCGCVTASPSPGVLAPRETGYLEVTVDTRRFTGTKTALIHVTVGPDYSSTAVLTVTASSKP
jgi:RNA polymerase sigma factor (sigma-70 family)